MTPAACVCIYDVGGKADMGGKVDNPTYKQVCSGTTGHAEVVETTFDPKVVAYGELLDVLFERCVCGTPLLLMSRPKLLVLTNCGLLWCTGTMPRL